MGVVYHYRYDVELYQRIEQLIDTRNYQYTIEGEVLSLMEIESRIVIMVK